MNLALTIHPDVSLSALIERVQLAEALGFTHCYVSDQGFSRDVFVTLTVLISHTERIRLGTGVTNPYTRHPVVTAVATANLYEQSQGRAFLGLGAGGSHVLDRMGLSRIAPLQACRESAEIARLLWNGDAVTYRGEHFQVTDARVECGASPEIELHWAARGPKMLALGGELADTVMLHGIPDFDLEKVVSSVRKGAEQADRKVKLQYSVPLVFDEASRQTARMRTAYRLVDSSDQVKRELNVTPEFESRLRNLLMTSGTQAAAPLISDEILSHYVLEGEPRVCASKVRQLFERYGLNGLTVELSDLVEPESLLPRAAEIAEHV